MSYCAIPPDTATLLDEFEELESPIPTEKPLTLGLYSFIISACSKMNSACTDTRFWKWDKAINNLCGIDDKLATIPWI